MNRQARLFVGGPEKGGSKRIEESVAVREHQI
jgi:hypothetical protein